MALDFTKVTEVPDSGATGEQHERLMHRYGWAKGLVENKRVLEVACGVGFGLGCMDAVAKSVVGGDYTHNLLRTARRHYGDRIPLVQLDGDHLPFTDGAFDLVLIFEAVYYLPDAERFVAEARRVLDKDGKLLIVSVNPEWDEFAPSPHSTQYLSARELIDHLKRGGFGDVECFGAFETGAGGSVQRVVSIIRRVVVALHLMPRTLEGRAKLKRLVYGSLKPLPAEIEAEVAVPEPLDRVSEAGEGGVNHKVLYCTGRR